MSHRTPIRTMPESLWLGRVAERRDKEAARPNRRRKKHLPGHPPPVKTLCHGHSARALQARNGTMPGIESELRCRGP